jgi:hypothetical protein
MKKYRYSYLGIADDKWDSFWLAHMIRLNILPQGYVYPKEHRSVRDLLRRRLLFVRHRTSNILSLGTGKAANFVNRHCSQALRFYQRKKARKNSVVAIKALGNKIRRASYYVMRDHVPFDVAKLYRK